MKKAILSLSLGLALAASACNECNKADEQIIAPAQMAKIYMDAQPSGQALAEGGCHYLAFQLKNTVEAAKMLREYAMSEYSPGVSHCKKWNEATRYVCESVDPSSTCQWTPFSQCEAWVKDVAGDWRYDSTMKLADYLDGMDRVVQNMCKLALDGNYRAAEIQAEGARRFIREKIVSWGFLFKNTSCQKRSPPNDPYY